MNLNQFHTKNLNIAWNMKNPNRMTSDTKVAKMLFLCDLKQLLDLKFVLLIKAAFVNLSRKRIDYLIIVTDTNLK